MAAKKNGKQSAPKFPVKLSACIDLAYTAREERKEFQTEMEARLKDLKAKEDAIHNHIIDSFSVDDISKMGGQIAVGSVEIQKHPTLKDSQAFFAYVAKTKQFDLIEKRVAKNAWRERLDAGVVVPGVEVFQKKVLHLNAIPKK